MKMLVTETESWSLQDNYFTFTELIPCKQPTEKPVTGFIQIKDFLFAE